MGKRLLLELDDSLRSLLEAFCEAHYGAPQVSIIREAIRAFIEERLAAEPELRKRFEMAHARRLGTTGAKIRVLKVAAKER